MMSRHRHRRGRRRVPRDRLSRRGLRRRRLLSGGRWRMGSSPPTGRRRRRLGPRGPGPMGCAILAASRRCRYSSVCLKQPEGPFFVGHASACPARAMPLPSPPLLPPSKSFPSNPRPPRAIMASESFRFAGGSVEASYCPVDYLIQQAFRRPAVSDFRSSALDPRGTLRSRRQAASVLSIRRIDSLEFQGASRCRAAADALVRARRPIPVALPLGNERRPSLFAGQNGQRTPSPSGKTSGMVLLRSPGGRGRAFRTSTIAPIA